MLNLILVTLTLDVCILYKTMLISIFRSTDQNFIQKSLKFHDLWEVFITLLHDWWNFYFSEAKSEIFAISSSSDKYSQSTTNSSSLSPSSPIHINSKLSSTPKSSSDGSHHSQTISYVAKPIGLRPQYQVEKPRFHQRQNRR